MFLSNLFLGIAGIFFLLVAVGFFREGTLTLQHKIWLLVGGIFLVVSFVVRFVISP